MNEPYLIAEAVPGIANVLAESARHPNHDRGGKSIRRAPTHRSAIVELLGGGIRVLAELNLGDRHQAADGHADGAANDPFLGKARVEHAFVAELPLKAFRYQVDSALASDVLAEHEQLWIDLELPA